MTVPSPSLTQEFGTIYQPHYVKLFLLLLSKDSRRLICMRLITNFRLLLVLFFFVFYCCNAQQASVPVYAAHYKSLVLI